MRTGLVDPPSPVSYVAVLVVVALWGFSFSRVAADDLVATIGAAPELNVEKVCAPIRSTRGGDMAWVPNPDGKTYDLLIKYFERYNENTHFVILDLGTGEVGHRHMERGFHYLGVVAPNGKMFSHGMDGIMVYDPATNELSQLPGAPGIGGETKPLILGPDGKVYGTGSTEGRAVAYQIDPANGVFTDYGKIGPSHAPNTCWGYSIAVDDRYVYVVSGKLPWYLVAYDRETNTDSVLLTLDAPEGIIMLGNVGGCVTANLRHGGGKAEESFWIHGGKAVARKDANEKPPAVFTPAPQAPPPSKPEMHGQLVPESGGEVELWFRSPEAKAAAPAHPAEGATLESLGWNRVAFEVPTYPAPVYQVFTLPDGRICGAAGNYQGLFLFDPNTNGIETSGGLRISVPIMAWQADRLFMTGYPRAATLAYDPRQPFGKENPSFIGSLGNEGSGIHEAYCLVSAADGCVYIGGGWFRNGEGGGLGWWNPEEKKAGGTSEGLSNYRVTHMTTAGDGRYVILSTKAVRDQEKNIPPPKQAKIFVYDTAEKKMLTSFETLPGAEHTGAIAGTTGTRVLAFTLDPEGPDDKPWHEHGSVLYAFDALTGKIAWQKKVPYPIGFVVNENYDGTVGFDFKFGPDRKIWTFSGGKMLAPNPEKAWGLAYEDACLVRISPDNGEISVVGKMGRVGRMAFHGKDLYLTGGGKYHTIDAGYLRRIKNVVP